MFDPYMGVWFLCGPQPCLLVVPFNGPAYKAERRSPREQSLAVVRADRRAVQIAQVDPLLIGPQRQGVTR